MPDGTQESRNSAAYRLSVRRRHSRYHRRRRRVRVNQGEALAMKVEEWLIGLGGAVVGGVFALLGGWVQAWTQRNQQKDRFVHERSLAREQHARDQVSRHNDQLATLVRLQLEHGRRQGIAAARFQFNSAPDNDEHARQQTLFDALRFAGVSWSTPSPASTFLGPEDLEDETLKNLVSQHRDLFSNVERHLTFADRFPEHLPANCAAVVEELDSLGRKILRRCRELQREGRAF